MNETQQTGTSAVCLLPRKEIWKTKTGFKLPGKSSPISHRSQPFPGNLGQGRNYLLPTRQSVCPGRRKKKTSNCIQRLRLILFKRNTQALPKSWIHIKVLKSMTSFKMLLCPAVHLLTQTMWHSRCKCISRRWRLLEIKGTGIVTGFTLGPDSESPVSALYLSSSACQSTGLNVKVIRLRRCWGTHGHCLLQLIQTPIVYSYLLFLICSIRAYLRLQ